MTTNETTLVHISEPHDVSIMRPFKWQNPYKIGVDGTRNQVLAKFEIWLRSNDKLMNDLDELKGEVLGCCCPPKKCHGEIIIKLINEKDRSEFLTAAFE